jgi:ParB-like chromosome segregation protein Spo0J
MKIEQIPTEKLIPYARNAKKHDAAQVSKLAGSIREFGFNNPVLIDKDNGIIAGHGRVMAAQKLELKEVPCIRLGHLTDTQRRAYILADNRLSEIGGGWDEEMLKNELTSLLGDGVDIAGLGWDDGWSEEEEKENEISEKIFEQSVQLDPAKEFIVIICEPSEYEEAKNILDLKQVRRGGYKEGSAFDVVSFERAITFNRLKDAIRNTK